MDKQQKHSLHNMQFYFDHTHLHYFEMLLHSNYQGWQVFSGVFFSSGKNRKKPSRKKQFLPVFSTWRWKKPVELEFSDKTCGNNVCNRNFRAKISVDITQVLYFDNFESPKNDILNMFPCIFENIPLLILSVLFALCHQPKVIWSIMYSKTQKVFSSSCR